MNLFLLHLKINGETASYNRDVIVLADTQTQAKQKAETYFMASTLEYRKVPEILAKFSANIFGVPQTLGNL